MKWHRTGGIGVMNWLAAGLVCVVGSAAVLIAGCESEAGGSPPPPPTVEVATPTTQQVTDYFQYTGFLEAMEQVDIRARVPGFLESVDFEESSAVEAGQVLFTIEKEPYEVAVGRARADLARAESALSLAEANRARTQQAFDADAANELELIADEAAVKQAEAEVLAAEQMLEGAELDLSYTDVVTPLSGRVDRNYVDVGNLVGGETATLLARVVVLDPVRVSFDVSESIALKYLSAGEDGSVNGDSPTVEVGLADEDGFPHAGLIDFVDSVVDQSTGTLLVRAVLPNPTGKLYPGLFARIRVPWDVRENAVVIHEEAVGTGLDGKYVLVADETDTVSRRSVELGERQDGGLIVVLEGLTIDDTYIVRGLQKARPGSKVTVEPFDDGTQSEPSGESEEPVEAADQSGETQAEDGGAS